METIELSLAVARLWKSLASKTSSHLKLLTPQPAVAEVATTLMGMTDPHEKIVVTEAETVAEVVAVVVDAVAVAAEVEAEAVAVDAVAAVVEAEVVAEAVAAVVAAEDAKPMRPKPVLYRRYNN